MIDRSIDRAILGTRFSFVGFDGEACASHVTDNATQQQYRVINYNNSRGHIVIRAAISLSRHRAGGREPVYCVGTLSGQFFLATSDKSSLFSLDRWRFTPRKSCSGVLSTRFEKRNTRREKQQITFSCRTSSG